MVKVKKISSSLPDSDSLLKKTPMKTKNKETKIANLKTKAQKVASKDAVVLKTPNKSSDPSLENKSLKRKSGGGKNSPKTPKKVKLDQENQDSLNGDSKDSEKTPKKIKMNRSSKSSKVENGTSKANKDARVALATGKILSSELDRKNDQDKRTLYIRFRLNPPAKDLDILNLDPNIKHVRIPRQGKKTMGVKYAFIEYSDEKECVKAWKKFSADVDSYFVDYVGEKSKKKTSISSKSGKSTKQKNINPLRLFVNGLPRNIKDSDLRKLFPKSTKVEIVTKYKLSATSIGFVEFSNPGDAKLAYDASKSLSFAGQSLTVLYARFSSRKKKKEEAKTEVDKKETANEVENDMEVESAQNEQEEEEESDAENEEECNIKDDEEESDVENDDDDDEEEESDVENDDDDDEEEEEE